MRRQGYYEWAARRIERPRRYRQDEVLTVKIENIFYESRRRYGARKIVRVLRREGWIVSRKRVRRLMPASGLVPVTFRRHVATTDSKHDLGASSGRRPWTRSGFPTSPASERTRAGCICAACLTSAQDAW